MTNGKCVSPPPPLATLNVIVCLDKNYFNSNIEILSNALVERGYPGKLIKQQIKTLNFKRTNTVSPEDPNVLLHTSLALIR